MDTNIKQQIGYQLIELIQTLDHLNNLKLYFLNSDAYEKSKLNATKHTLKFLSVQHFEPFNLINNNDLETSYLGHTDVVKDDKIMDILKNIDECRRDIKSFTKKMIFKILNFDDSKSPLELDATHYFLSTQLTIVFSVRIDLQKDEIEILNIFQDEDIYDGVDIFEEDKQWIGLKF